MPESSIEFCWKDNQVTKFGHQNISLSHLLNVIDVTTELAFSASDDKEATKAYILTLIDKAYNSN